MLAEDALFGLGVDLFLLLVEGVLRGPRGLPLGQPWCFFGFISSAGVASCTNGCETVVAVSSGGVCICVLDATAGTLLEYVGTSSTGFVSVGG